MRGRAGDSKSKAQFTFEHPGATFWSCTKPKIKAQFGPGYLGAVQHLHNSNVAVSFDCNLYK